MVIRMVPAGSGRDSEGWRVRMWDFIESNESNVFRQYGHEYLASEVDGVTFEAELFDFFLGMGFLLARSLAGTQAPMRKILI